MPGAWLGVAVGGKGAAIEEDGAAPLVRMRSLVAPDGVAGRLGLLFAESSYCRTFEATVNVVVRLKHSTK